MIRKPLLAIWIGVGVAVVMVLFAPWKDTVTGEFLGYHSFVSEQFGAQLDVKRLLYQLLFVVVVEGIVLVVIKRTGIIGTAGDWILKGKRAGRRQYYEVALACFENALILDRRNSSAWYYRGLCLKNLGRLRAALWCLDRATKLDPRDKMAPAKRREVRDLLLSRRMTLRQMTLRTMKLRLPRRIRMPAIPTGILSRRAAIASGLAIVVIGFLFIRQDPGGVRPSDVSMPDGTELTRVSGSGGSSVARSGGPADNRGDSGSKVSPGGHGRLLVNNATAQDAVVKIVPTGPLQGPCRQFYVKAHSTAEKDDIGGGVCHVAVMLGCDWSVADRRFRRGETLSRFPDNFDFDVRDRWSVTLHAVPNSKQTLVSDEEWRSEE